MITRTLSSPVGELVLSVAKGAVVSLEFHECVVVQDAADTSRDPRDPDRRAADAIASALDRYFDGDLDAFESIDLAADGTLFQRRVWDALRRIAPGTTTTYATIARAIGAPHAARAVGAANGANPIAIIVPCHRVIGANGTLTGYAGGLERKKWLLEHERRNLPRARVSAMECRL